MRFQQIGSRFDPFISFVEKGAVVKTLSEEGTYSVFFVVLYNTMHLIVEHTSIC